MGPSGTNQNHGATSRNALLSGETELVGDLNAGNRRSSSMNMFPLETSSAVQFSDHSFSDGQSDAEEGDENCLRWYWKDCVWPGLGLFGESYLLFSIGTMQPIWEMLFEECFYEDCAPSLLSALHYSVVLGVISGMLAIGYASKFTGRRTGSLITACLMASGAAGLTMTSLFLTENQETLVRSMVFFWFLFGVGVGGEYPMAASQASENAAALSNERSSTPQQSPAQQQQSQPQSSSQHNNGGPDNNSHVSMKGRDGVMVMDGDIRDSAASGSTVAPSHRGRQVQLVFSMQGLGILLNSVTMTALLLIATNYVDRLEDENTYLEDQNEARAAENDDDANAMDDRYAYGKYQLNDISSATASSLLTIWRVTYAFGTLVLGYVWYSRYYYLKESKIWLKLQKQEQQHQHGSLSDTPPPRTVGPDLPQPSQIVYATTTTTTKHASQNDTDWNTSALDLPSTGTPQGQEMPLSRYQGGATSISTAANQQQSSPLTATNTTPATSRAVVQPGSSPHTTRDSHNPTPQELQALSIVPTLSVVSSVSSLSAPSVLAQHSSSDDENLYYHFMPDSGEAACGPGDKWLLLYRLYGMRLFGVSASWLLWDIAFYGNKLFQSTFLLAMLGNSAVNNNNNQNDDGGGNDDGNKNNFDEDASLHSLLDFSLCAMLNASVAFLGYIVAAFLVDVPTIGRRRLQQWGLIATGILFVCCGFLIDRLSSNWLVILLYFGTSFFGQVGPNCTTFLIPAEIFPTEVRTLCHGIAAASGKLGALCAAIMFNYTQSDLDMFLLSGYASLVAGAVTFWTIPESLGLPLEELDKKWKQMKENKPYHGPANLAKFLSFYERNHQRASQTGDPVTTTTATTDYRPEVDVY